MVLDFSECDEAELLADGCNFPYIRLNMTDPVGPEKKCSETYAARIAPYHTIACSLYGLCSGILLLVLALWSVNAFLDFIQCKPRKRGLEYRMRMHVFAALAALCNLLASVDLKGYAARLPLVATEVFNELAYSSLLCLLFHMVNQWVDVITLGGRQKWGKRQHALLPYMCVLVTAVRVGLGIAQWTSVPNGPHKGQYDGNLNALKLFVSFLAMALYCGIGLYSSVYEPLQSKKQAQRQSASSPSPVRRPSSDTTNNNDHDNTNDADGGGDTSMTSRFAYYLGLRSASSANNNSNNSASSTANQKKKKKTVLHTRYLYGLFAILFVYVLYLGAGVNGRLGKVEERGIPCSIYSKIWYTNQGVMILLLLAYVTLSSPGECNSAKGGGCAMPKSLAERKKAQIMAAKKKQEAARAADLKERQAAQSQSASSTSSSSKAPSSSSQQLPRPPAPSSASSSTSTTSSSGRSSRGARGSLSKPPKPPLRAKAVQMTELESGLNVSRLKYRQEARKSSTSSSSPNDSPSLSSFSSRKLSASSNAMRLSSGAAAGISSSSTATAVSASSAAAAAAANTSTDAPVNLDNSPLLASPTSSAHSGGGWVEDEDNDFLEV